MQQFATLEKSTINIPSTAQFSIKKIGNTPGYDAHCLRAFAYFGEEMPDIDGNSVESINSIGTKYKALRGESKAPTFAF